MNSPLIGLDIGLKRTGVSLSESGMIAQPLTVIEAKPPHFQSIIPELLSLIEKYEAKTVVVGLPFSEDESITSQALKTEKIIQELEEELQKKHPTTELIRVNEFHSSQDADALFPTVDRDSAAATIILQDYIDIHS